MSGVERGEAGLGWLPAWILYYNIVYIAWGVSCLDIGDHVVLVVPQTRLYFCCRAADLGLYVGVGSFGCPLLCVCAASLHSRMCVYVFLHVYVNNVTDGWCWPSAAARQLLSAVLLVVCSRVWLVYVCL